jgi:surface antigen
MMRVLIVGAVAVFGLAVAYDSNAEGDKDPKFKIKEVMQKAMKGGLCGKVAKGEASAEEKKQLIELFTALAANKPPKGDDASWKEKTKALLDAAKADDGKALAKAANCKACHSEHKGK